MPELSPSLAHLYAVQIWQMKQQEVHGMAQKLLQADRVVHEQQLGWQWQGPDEDALLAGLHSPQASKALLGSKKRTAGQTGSATELAEDGGETEGVQGRSKTGHKHMHDRQHGCSLNNTQECVHDRQHRYNFWQLVQCVA